MRTMTKKRGRPVQQTTRNSPPRERVGRNINIWLEPELGEALDAYLGSLRLRPSTKTVVEVAIKDYLAAQGFWPPKE